MMLTVVDLPESTWLDAHVSLSAKPFVVSVMGGQTR